MKIFKITHDSYAAIKRKIEIIYSFPVAVSDWELGPGARLLPEHHQNVCPSWAIRRVRKARL